MLPCILDRQIDRMGWGQDRDGTGWDGTRTDLGQDWDRLGMGPGQIQDRTGTDLR